ncbi:hypothetical protein ACH5RR_021551 [Cinchona calisaya]|uniref:DUF4283 domain-containing protein n=1 Tax=Cinchona calisaya TaxID=153742 RepID=A0ABD2ZKJ0_9GENT
MVDFLGSFTQGFIDSCHVLIGFDLEEDYHRYWLQGFYSFEGFGIRVLKWTLYFHVDSESPAALVWVSLKQLPLYLYEKHLLYSIIMMIGQPLKTDVSTTSLSSSNVACFYVEVVVSKPFLKCFWIAKRGHAMKDYHILHPSPPQLMVDTAKDTQQ